MLSGPIQVLLTPGLKTVYDFRSPMKNVVPGALKRYFSSWPGAPNDSLLLHTLKTLFSLSLS